MRLLAAFMAVMFIERYGKVPQNGKDRYAVAVKKNETIIPRKFSKLCSLVLRRGGNIACIITGRRRYSTDLPQGGLKVPCRLTFKANDREIDKLKRLIHLQL